jgi:hypothetical protein
MVSIAQKYPQPDLNFGKSSTCTLYAHPLDPALPKATAVATMK